MANPRRGEVDVEIGGDTYPLVYDWNVISELEAKFNDRPINELFQSGSGAVPARVIREALRLGMEKRGRKKTSNEVGKMIGDALQKDPDAYLKIVKAVTEGVSGAFGLTGETRAPADVKESAKETADASVPPDAVPAIGAS